MSNYQVKTCIGCIYEDCYVGICTACRVREKSELRHLSDLVRVHFNSFTIYHLSFSLGAPPSGFGKPNTPGPARWGRVRRG